MFDFILLWTDSVIIFSVIKFYHRVIENQCEVSSLWVVFFSPVIAAVIQESPRWLRWVKFMSFFFYNKEEMSNRKHKDVRKGICREEDKKSQERLKKRKILESIYKDGRISLNAVFYNMFYYILHLFYPARHPVELEPRVH